MKIGYAVEEQVTWYPSRIAVPGDDTVVLVHHPLYRESTWLGYTDDSGVWRSIDGMRLPEIPTHWAEIPRGPNG